VTFPALAAVLVLILSSCSGDDDPSGRSPVAIEGQLATSVSVEASDFVFDPDLWRVVAEGTTAFDMVNVGSVEHNWVLIALGSEVANLADIEALGPSDILWEQETLQAGESAIDSFTAPAPGAYQVICSVPGHFDLGMKGTLQTALAEEGEA
jgi:plastocyanin